jgi:hypothetical protein
MSIRFDFQFLLISKILNKSLIDILNRNLQQIIWKDTKKLQVVILNVTASLRTLAVSKRNKDPSQKRFRNSPDVQPGRFCHCWHVIIRPRRLCRDSCANGPQLQGVSAKVLAKAEKLGADALQLGTSSIFNSITSL